MQVKMQVVNVEKWCEEHRESFLPPICNKLLHKNDLSIMFVGGPNSRTDFHLEDGSELFFQLRGSMTLPTIQAGKRRDVHINEGHLFILPSRIPHSPQRKENSLGLVVERARCEGEFDALMWFIDETCEEKLFERYFICNDLGQDLVPVVNEFKSSSEFTSRQKTPTSLYSDPPCKQDTSTTVPDPVNLWKLIEDHKDDLEAGKQVDLIKVLDHPDREFQAVLQGGACEAVGEGRLETFVFQLRGVGALEAGGDAAAALGEGDCVTLPRGTPWRFAAGAKEAVRLLISQDPRGNRAA